MNTIQGGISCLHHNTVQVMNNLKTLNHLSVNVLTVEKRRKYFPTNLTGNINVMVAARRSILNNALWTLEFRAKPDLEKIAAGHEIKTALSEYDCLNKQR